MKLNRRQLIAAGATVAIGATAGTAVLMLQNDDPKGASSRIDLLTGVYDAPPHRSDPLSFAMLSITGGMAGKTTLELRLFDLSGDPADASGDINVSLANLITGDSLENAPLNVDADHWAIGSDALASNGWWQIVANIGQGAASWTIMLPDANLTGFDTPPEIESQPDAERLLLSALDTLKSRTSLRWWEWLSGGNGSIILAEFGVTTTASNGLPNSFVNHSMLAGQIPLDGSAPKFRKQATRTITVGDAAVSIVGDGTPTPTNPVRYLPIAEYDTTYSGFNGAHFGITADIDGIECQLVAFHLPSATEAWFAFWIETSTLTIREIFMHSVNHYMHWVYFDIDEPFEINLS